MWSLDVYASGDMAPSVSAIVIFASLVTLVPAIIIWLLRSQRRRAVAAAAEASVGGESRPLAEGKDVVLCGVVRHFEDNDVAVKVKVTQSGTENESSGSWTHSWTEIDRDIEVRPFLLELPDGQLVRVDPPKNVDVADALDQKVWIDRNRRMLSAELVPGEQIWARGRLQRSDIATPGSAYRDVAWGWALGPTDGQMLLSSEPLGVGLRQRASFHARYAIMAIALLCAIQLSLGWFYSRLSAETVIVEVASKQYYQTTDSDGDSHDHHVITLAPSSNVNDRTVHISDDDYMYIDAGSRVPIRRATASNWNLGASATLAIWHGLFVFSLPFALLVAYAYRRRASRPWFRRKVNESGPGRLSPL